MKIKIAIIGVKGLPAIGGASRANEAMIKYLSEQYDISVYEVDSHKDSVMSNLTYKSILFKGSRMKRMNTFLYYTKSCFHALFLSDYDIVHTQHLYSGFIVPFLKIRFKVVNTVRGIIPDDDNKWNSLDKKMFRLFEKISLKFSDVSVSVSQPQIKYLQSLTKKKVSYIPNGVDIDQNLLGGREKIENDCLVFSAARIIKLKGCHTFLKSLHLINYGGKVKIIGSLEHVQNYKTEIFELANGLDVSFLGLISNKEKLFNELLTAKYFVFPSTKEGLSNMLLEVASLKIPIICSDIEENKAVFNDDEVLFFNTEDHIDLAEKIKYAMDHNESMELRASRALERLKKDYQWGSIAEEYKKIYNQLISGY